MLTRLAKARLKLATRVLSTWNDNSVVLEVDTTITAIDVEEATKLRLINSSGDVVFIEIQTGAERFSKRFRANRTEEFDLPTATFTRDMRNAGARRRWYGMDIRAAIPG